MREAAQRDAILHAAFEKFRRLGIRRVTMDELARDLRISKKTLYRHFADKEALVRACTLQLQETVLPRAKAALEGGGSVGARMTALWRILAAAPGHMSVELVSDLKADYPHLWAEIDARRRMVLSGLEEMLRAGIASGEVRPTVHPAVAARVLQAVLDRVLVPETFLSGGFTPRQGIDTVMTLFVFGTLVDPPAAPEGDDP